MSLTTIKPSSINKETARVLEEDVHLVVEIEVSPMVREAECSTK